MNLLIHLERVEDWQFIKRRKADAVVFNHGRFPKRDPDLPLANRRRISAHVQEGQGRNVKEKKGLPKKKGVKKEKTRSGTAASANRRKHMGERSERRGKGLKLHLRGETRVKRVKKLTET